jgi:hypothetical protein
MVPALDWPWDSTRQGNSPLPNAPSDAVVGTKGPVRLRARQESCILRGRTRAVERRVVACGHGTLGFRMRGGRCWPGRDGVAQRLGGGRAVLECGDAGAGPRGGMCRSVIAAARRVTVSAALAAQQDGELAGGRTAQPVVVAQRARHDRVAAARAPVVVGQVSSRRCGFRTISALGRRGWQSGARGGGQRRSWAPGSCLVTSSSGREQ